MRLVAQSPMVPLDSRISVVGNCPTFAAPRQLLQAEDAMPTPLNPGIPSRRPSTLEPRLRLGVLPVFVLAAIASVLLVALAGCGGGGGTEAAPAAPPEPRATGLSAGRSGELVAQAQRLLRERAGAGQTYAPLPMPGATTVAAGNVSADRSDTLVQEAGVDEADLLKSDGVHLYSVSRSASGEITMAVHRRGNDGRVSLVRTMPLPSSDGADIAGQGLMLADNGRAAVLVSRRWKPMDPPEACADICPPQPMVPIGSPSAAATDVQRLTISDGQPSLGDSLRIEGRLVDSRRVGDRLVLVTQHRPVLPPDLLPATATAAEREVAIARVNARDLLPKFSVNGGALQPLLAETDCWVQPANASKTLEIVSIIVVDLRSSALARTSRCFMGGTEAVYMTTSALYLATTRWSYPDNQLPVVFPADIRTDLHKFAFDAATGTLNYRASGDVPGHLGWDPTRKSWRLSEHEGALRVLTFTGPMGWVSDADAAASKPASPATLTVLREAAGSFQVVSTLPNAQRPAALGKPGEQVYGVRFVGNQGFVVTFRRVDPLYVLDLANPADPKIAGELELPGFSDHLVPLGNGLLFAVGRDATDTGRVLGVKVALIDVSNPAAPRERASRVLGGVGSYSALDFSRHGLNLMLADGKARVALPVMSWVPGTLNWTDRLMRWEVDLAAGSLADKPAIAERTGSLYPDVGMQRSLQIGSDVFYLRGGELVSGIW
jgi:hypothetical protein